MIFDQQNNRFQKKN